MKLFRNYFTSRVDYLSKVLFRFLNRRGITYGKEVRSSRPSKNYSLTYSLTRSFGFVLSIFKSLSTYMHSRGTHLMIAYGIFQFSLHSEYFFLQILRYLHIFLLRLVVFPPCSKIQPILAREEEDGKPLLPLTLTLPPN